MPASLKPSWIKTDQHDVYPAIDSSTTLAGTASGKTILITGSGRGIGRAIAQGFAAAGASRIIITSRTSSELDAVAQEIAKVSSKVEVQKIITDVTSRESVTELFAQVSGHVDVLVNNAGVLEPCVPMGEQSIDTWVRTWDVNIKGTFLPIHALLNRQKTGIIINTSSVGSIGTRPGFSAYQPSKTAINRITDFLDKEYPGMKVFSYHPGGVMTELAKKAMPKETWPMLNDTPELAGNYCVWLASGQADFLSGRYSSCNWDVEELVAMKDKIVEKDLLKEMVEMEF